MFLKGYCSEGFLSCYAPRRMVYAGSLSWFGIVNLLPELHTGSVFTSCTSDLFLFQNISMYFRFILTDYTFCYDLIQMHAWWPIFLLHYAAFYVLMAVNLKSAVLFVVTPCSSEINSPKRRALSELHSVKNQRTALVFSASFIMKKCWPISYHRLGLNTFCISGQDLFGK
jgi:hypothetical protein